VGDGFAGVTRVNDPFTIIDDVDCFVFPDISFAGFQIHLEKLGHRVWGARETEDIEMFKSEFRELCKGVGIPVAPYKVVNGITKARKVLEGQKNKWLKIDGNSRGNFETFEVEELDVSESDLEEVTHGLGPWKEKQEIIIEDTFEDSIEIAFDLWTVDGQFPQKAIFGIEQKGELYCCHTMAYNDLPWQIQDLNERLAPLLKAYRARTNFPVEIRTNKEGQYVALDPCVREAFPASGAKQVMINNFPDVFWFGSEGEMVEPEFEIEDAWGLELVLSSSRASKEPKAVYVPDKIRDSIKLRYAAEVDGIPWVLPQLQENITLGSIAVTNKSWEKGKKEILEIKGQIKGGGVDASIHAFDDFKKNWEALINDYGINLPKIN
jgi:hypothetical protein